jgi:hypothetical protein
VYRINPHLLWHVLVVPLALLLLGGELSLGASEEVGADEAGEGAGDLVAETLLSRRRVFLTRLQMQISFTNAFMM